jgi:pimeloyl-ACP methyl ester carboxylesterase
MAEDTIGFLEAVVGRRAYPLGCSDGATVALLVALRRRRQGNARARLRNVRGVDDAELMVVPGTSHASW